MSNIGRRALVEKAKKIYKQNTKEIPRRKRVSFSIFFKNYRKMLKAQSVNKVQPTEQIEQDNANDEFDLRSIINVEDEPQETNTENTNIVNNEILAGD